MAKDQASFKCPQCGVYRLFTGERPNHVLHLLLTLFLCGAWFVPWIIISCQSRPMYCSTCGYSDNPFYLADPGRRFREDQERFRRRERTGELLKDPRLWAGGVIALIAFLFFLLIVSRL